MLHDATRCVKRQYKLLKSVIMSPLDAKKHLVYNGFYCFCVVACALQYGEGHNISISRLRYLAKHNALDIWPIRAHFASRNNELCKNMFVSERLDIEEHFFFLKPHKHIALHQIHKIMFFLATSYDPLSVFFGDSGCSAFILTHSSNPALKKLKQ